jgi:hypothetical protein
LLRMLCQKQRAGAEQPPQQQLPNPKSGAHHGSYPASVCRLAQAAGQGRMWIS